jgi:hypothetical protein
MQFSRKTFLFLLVCLIGFSSVASAQQADEPPANGKAKNGADDKTKNGDDDKDKDKAKNDKPAKTLFEWAIGPKEEENGNGDEEPTKRIDADRPHFPEASTTVGLGRVVLESGYTFNSQGGTFHSHSFPEANLRIGMFAEWFEFRIQQDFFNQTQTLDDVKHNDKGAADLSLGVKLALTEQKGCLPESAIILQMTVPSGARAFTFGQVEPGVNYDFSWDVIKDKFSIEGVISANGNHVLTAGQEPLEAGHSFVQFATGLTAVFDITHNLQNFTEWYGLYPAGGRGDPDVGPQHYLVTGFLYYFSDNFFIDVRAGVGLTEHSNDYLLGSGLAIRY